MMRYSPSMAASLLWLCTLTGLSASQSTWTLDPQKHLARISDHMSAVVNSTIYTIGGTAIYWTPKLTPSSIVSDNNNSVYILKTANSFLRALDLSKPVDFEAEFSDTSEVISELPFEIPHAKLGAAWADQNTIYYWGGDLVDEPVYLDGAFQNRTREWVDPMKYYTYNLSQPRGSGMWETVSISSARGSDTLTSSLAYGESTYSGEARKGFYFGGVVSRSELKNIDGSNGTRTGTGGFLYEVNSMVVFDAVTNVWRNQTIISDLNYFRNGAMVYVAGVGEKGILVRMGGTHYSEFVSFSTVYVYDIASGSWYRQPTTSKTNTFPETRNSFCAGAVASPDKTSFTIYIYGGSDNYSYRESTWALTMPYFHWVPVGSTGAPEHGRTATTCQTIGGQLVMVRGRGNQKNRGDTNGGTYFYDMTNLTWSLKYQPSEYRVPKTIYDVIGGNGQGGATITSPVDDRSYIEGLGKLFAAAANRANSPSPNNGSSNSAGGGSSSSAGGGSSSSTGGGISHSTGSIVGGVIGGITALAAIVAGILTLLRHYRRSADVAKEREARAGGMEVGTGRNWPWRYEIDSVPVPQPVYELDNPGV
ncbi:hypothetical protein HOY80DRAFT_165609 [Tuber brumale]|nr:hypothetical protein HOY80DRAFT_165609 [Tuber brumale]